MCRKLNKLRFFHWWEWNHVQDPGIRHPLLPQEPRGYDKGTECKKSEVMAKIQKANRERSWQRYRRQTDIGHGKDTEVKQT